MNILVVDDHPMMVESWASELRFLIPESKIFTAFSGTQALEMISDVKPAVILLDINMPGMNGYDVAKTVLKMDVLPMKVIIFTNFDADAMVLNLIELGVHGLLFKKSCDGNEMKMCIDRVLHGEKYYCKSVDDIILRNVNKISDLPKVQFTARELRLLMLLADGKSSKEISVILTLKENTVNSYRDELMRKTKTSNVAELVAFTMRNGLIPL